MDAGNSNRKLIRDKIFNKKIIVVGFIFVVIAIFAACSPKGGSGFLKFIFDGVPDKNKKDTVAVTLISPKDSLTKSLPVSVKPAEPTTFFHVPYKERACTKCHNVAAPNKMAFSQDEVCYTCHTDFQKNYNFVHGPVAAGFCTTCHAPHFSNNKKLLIRKGQDLCLNCHTKIQIMQNVEHADIGNTNCTECHNPHGGSNRFILN